MRIQAAWRRRRSDCGLRQRQLSRPQSTELSRRGSSSNGKLRGSRPGSGSKLRGTGNRSREPAAAPAAAEPAPPKKVAVPGAGKPFVHVVSDDISAL